MDSVKGQGGPSPTPDSARTMADGTAARQEASQWPLVPPDAPEPDFHSRQHGDPECVYAYRDGSGGLLMYVRRYPTAKALPLTWQDGRWQAKALPTPRPLYGLDALARLPGAPVLVVEGEKTAAAAGTMFPDHVAVTSPNGASAAAKADWSPMVGRNVTIWPDHDAEGARYAADVARLALAAGAAATCIVTIPDWLPPKWDLADPLPDGRTQGDLAALLTAATTAAPAKPTLDLPAGFEVRANGYWYDPGGDKEAYRLCGPFEFVAETRDAESGEWGVIIAFVDRAGDRQRQHLANRDIGADRSDIFGTLAGRGLYVSSSGAARRQLRELLQQVSLPARHAVTNRIGWHGSAFVLGERIFGGSEGVPLEYLPTGQPLPFATSGTLADWQASVAVPCEGNSRLILALGIAFCGPLLAIMGEDGFGLHLFGSSSIGKTTALNVAASVWGPPADMVRTWRNTANALEGAAVTHNDNFLALDELSQVEGRDAGQVAYMLGNGRGKGRADKAGAARAVAAWRLPFLSTGELTLAEKVAEDKGGTTRAGQEVRFIDVPADPGFGLGLFEDLHDAANGGALAQALVVASAGNHGSAAIAWLEYLTGIGKPEARRRADGHMRFMLAQWRRAGDSSQVSRVARRFALVGAAVELAREAGIIPLSQGAGIRAAEAGFLAWVTHREGRDAQEDMQAIARTRAFLQRHGSRFQTFTSEPSVIAVKDCAGWRKISDHGGWDYLIFPDVWNREVMQGLNAKTAYSHLAERGYARRSNSGHGVKTTLPDSGRKSIRVMWVKTAILGAGADHDGEYGESGDS